MATKGKKTVAPEDTHAAGREHYGRVYISAGGAALPAQYRGVIWHGTTGKKLHDTAFCATPDEAYDHMKLHAPTLDAPVQLYRHGNVKADYISDLPF